MAAGMADQPADAISPAVRRLLVRRIARELQAAGKLAYFSGVAETGGFLDVVESFLSEIGRHEIWPKDFDAVLSQVGGVAGRDQALLRIYERDQAVLLQNDWYDNEGRFWLARTALVEGKCRHLPDWSMIAVVGFADFTRPQTEILEALAERAGAAGHHVARRADNESTGTLHEGDRHAAALAWSRSHRTVDSIGTAGGASAAVAMPTLRQPAEMVRPSKPTAYRSSRRLAPKVKSAALPDGSSTCCKPGPLPTRFSWSPLAQ